MQDKFIPDSPERRISVSVVNAAEWIGCNKDTAGQGVSGARDSRIY